MAVAGGGGETAVVPDLSTAGAVGGLGIPAASVSTVAVVVGVVERGGTESANVTTFRSADVAGDRRASSLTRALILRVRHIALARGHA